MFSTLCTQKKSVSPPPPPVGGGLHNPPPMGSGRHNPPTYETVYITLLNFSKSVKLPPNAVLKNNNKSHKNIKMENPIMLGPVWTAVAMIKRGKRK